MLAYWAEEETLSRLSYNLGGFAARPGTDRTVKPEALPPWRILTSDVDRQLHCRGQRLADLVSRHQ